MVVEKSTHNLPLLPAFRRHVWYSITQPATFLTSRPSLLVWSLYAATFTTANTSETLFNQVFPHIDRAIAGTTTFISTFLVNTSIGIWKDVKFAQLFGHRTTANSTAEAKITNPSQTPKAGAGAAGTTAGGAGAAKAGASVMAARSVSRSIPLATYSAFLFRDGLTIFGSFNLAPMVSASIPDFVASNELLKILVAHMGVPAAIQWINTPIHLFGLDLYNRAGPVPIKDRLNRVTRDMVGASMLRMCRIIPAFGIGGFANTEGRTFLQHHLNRVLDN